MKLYQGKTYVDLAKSPEVKDLVDKARGYKQAKSAVIEVFKGPMELRSGWSSGSREDYTLIEIATGRHQDLPTDVGCHPAQSDAPVLEHLPAGFALVECSMFQGKAQPATVYVSAETLNRMALPETPALTDDEKWILRGISSLKSGPYRQEHMRKIPIDRYGHAMDSLKRKGLVRGGGITVEGRNAIKDEESVY